MRARLSSSRLRPRPSSSKRRSIRSPAPGERRPQQYGHGYGHKPYKRRKSFLEDLFD